MHEYPLSVLEHEGFNDVLSSLQPCGSQCLEMKLKWKLWIYVSLKGLRK